MDLLDRNLARGNFKKGLTVLHADRTITRGVPKAEGFFIFTKTGLELQG